MTSSKYPHLDDAIAIIADQPPDVRIQYIEEDRFITYDAQDLVLTDFERVLKHPDRLRPEGRLLVGRPLMGKSTILNEFSKRYPPNDNPDGEAAIIPVVYIQYPEQGGEGIYYEILRTLNAKIPKTSKPAHVRRSAISLLKEVQMKVLLVDELHNVLQGGNNEQKKGLNSIKFIMNELGRPVIAAGTHEAYNAVRFNEQMISRLRPVILERFKDDEEFQALLKCFEFLLPLKKPSNLDSPKLATLIHDYTKGIMGQVSYLLTQASIYAIENGKERITYKMIEKSMWGVLGDTEINERLK